LVKYDYVSNSPKRENSKYNTRFGDDIIKVNCSELLNKATKELKTLMHKAQKIVCGDNLHIVLDRNDKLDFEIIEGTSSFVKIPIHNKIPPV
jgi:hypothetical protein